MNATPMTPPPTAPPIIAPWGFLGLSAAVGAVLVDVGVFVGSPGMVELGRVVLANVVKVLPVVDGALLVFGAVVGVTTAIAVAKGEVT
jgi:hypothetical protein